MISPSRSGSPHAKGRNAATGAREARAMELFAISCTTCQARLGARHGSHRQDPGLPQVPEHGAGRAARGLAASGTRRHAKRRHCRSCVNRHAGCGVDQRFDSDGADDQGFSSDGRGIARRGAGKCRGAAPTPDTSAPSSPGVTSPAAQAGLPPTPARRPAPHTAVQQSFVEPAPIPYEQINPNDIPPVPMPEPGESIVARLMTAAGQRRVAVIAAPVAALLVALLAWLLLRLRV